MQALYAVHMHEVWTLVACTCALYLPPAKCEYVSVRVKNCLHAPISEHYTVKAVTACCHQRPRPGKPVVEVDLVSEYTVLQVLNTMAWRGNACWCVAVFLRSHAHACACLLMLAQARVCERPSVLLVLCWWASFAELYASNQSYPPGWCPGFSLHSRPGYSTRAFSYMPSAVKPCE